MIIKSPLRCHGYRVYCTRSINEAEEFCAKFGGFFFKDRSISVTRDIYCCFI
jgi:hypothetical protein